METYLKNYLLMERYLKIDAPMKKKILALFKDYSKIQWHYIRDNAHFFDIKSDVILPGMATSQKMMDDCRDEMARMRHLGVESIDPLSIYYPDTLKHYSPPVKMLFAKGDKTLANVPGNVAIVGSRKPTAYGRKVAYDLGSYLAKNKRCVISGMALGVDAQAHQGALDAHGQTVAVLASGINIPYPATNEKLYKEIIEKNGLILSEQFLDDPARTYHFPLRNRIISALSEVVVVIEAGEKSGSLITATHALEQGKTIFALPGSIYSPQSKGCNQLIHQGAIPLIEFEHILEIMGYESKSDQLKHDLSTLSETAKKIYLIMKENKKMSLDEINCVLKLEFSEIISAVSELILDDLCEYCTLNEIIMI